MLSRDAKLKATFGILGAALCAGCATSSALDQAEDRDIAPESAIATNVTPARTIAAPNLLTTPAADQSDDKTLASSPLHRVNTGFGPKTGSSDIILHNYIGAISPSFGPPALNIVSAFNEQASPISAETGLRLNGDLLAIDQLSTAPALTAIRGQLGAQRLSYGTLGQERYEARLNLAAPSSVTGLNFDLGFVPSLSYAQEGDFSVRRVGAEFRLGQDIDQRGNYGDLPGWYLFAGADGEAVIFNNNTASNGLGLINGLQLRDQVTVGDIQAGLNVRRYGTNIAFNYIRREVEYELNSETLRRDEDFGGITFTWRR